MPDRFDKFTKRAGKVVQLAQEEAQRLNHNFIGTEHIQLGLVREGDGVAARALNNLGIELHRVRSGVESIIGRGDRKVIGEIGLTPRAKRVIELAVDEAKRLNHHYIGTEHLLLGLVREGEGIAAGVLESQGASLEKVRAEVLSVLKASSGAASAGPAGQVGAMRVEGRLSPEGVLSGNFSIHAQKVLERAHAEAVLLDHNYIGTEHLLLGLIGAHGSVAARVLAGLGLELEKVRATVDSVVGMGSSEQLSTEAQSLTPRTKRIFELAMRETGKLNHERAGTGHLLLGLCIEGQGIAAGVLERLGVPVEQVRIATAKALENEDET